MKHSIRLSKIKPCKKPHGYRKIVVDNQIFWWNAYPHGSGFTVLNSERKNIYDTYWGDDCTIRPKMIADTIKKLLTFPATM